VRLPEADAVASGEEFLPEDELQLCDYLARSWVSGTGVLEVAAWVVEGAR